MSDSDQLCMKKIHGYKTVYTYLMQLWALESLSPPLLIFLMCLALMSPVSGVNNARQLLFKQGSLSKRNCVALQTNYASDASP